ncbi:unnamed protein product [Absidia cylindrospora]
MCTYWMKRRELIFSIMNDCDNTKKNFIMRFMYTMSEQVHCPEPRLTNSEVTYCHDALWPLLKLVTRYVEGRSCLFKVGKPHLKAIDVLPRPTPDGMVAFWTSRLGWKFFSLKHLAQGDRRPHTCQKVPMDVILCYDQGYPHQEPLR